MQLKQRAILIILVLWALLLALVPTHSSTETTPTQIADDDPKSNLHAAIMEEYQSITMLSVAARYQFQHFQQKHSRIIKRDDVTFSYHSVPTISYGEEWSPTVYRVFVPSRRDVWLRYGVFAHETEKYEYPDSFRAVEPALSDTSFRHEGIFQYKLPPGEHVVAIREEQTLGIRIKIKLDDQAVLSTAFESQFLVYSGSNTPAAHGQQDFARDQRLPWLFVSELYPQSKLEKSIDPAPHLYLIWVSDAEKDHPAFPLTP